MFYSPKLYFRDISVLIPLLGSVLVQIFLWVYLIANIRPDAGQIFLHYNIIFGVDLVGQWWRIYMVPLAGIVVILLNYLLSLAFYSTDKFLARIMAAWVLFFHLFLMIGLTLLIRLNI